MGIELGGKGPDYWETHVKSSPPPSKSSDTDGAYTHMPTRPQPPQNSSLDTQEDCEQWIRFLESWRIDHDARIDVYWENQRRINSDLQKKMFYLQKDIISLKMKLVWFSGAGAVIGAAFGTVVIPFILK